MTKRTRPVEVVFEDFGDELHITFVCPHCDQRSWVEAPMSCYDDFTDDGAVYP